MEPNFLQFEETGAQKEAQWNMFHFQDHLLSWVSMSAQYFQNKDYLNSFESLTIVYTDAFGFFTKKEQQDLEAKFKTALDAVSAYTKYNIDYDEIRRKVAHHLYQPPAGVYPALLEFRKTLLNYMTIHGLTMKQIKKSQSGAGDQ